MSPVTAKNSKLLPDGIEPSPLDYEPNVLAAKLWKLKVQARGFEPLNPSQGEDLMSNAFDHFAKLA